MTTLLARPDSSSQWGSMPGWNIVADLTPPELTNVRWIAVLRRRILAGLVAVVLLCAAGYVYAYKQHSSASDGAAAASAQTIDLQRAQSKYSGITQIEGAVTAIRAQIAQVMVDDVDVAHLTAAIRGALPSSMTIQNLTVTLTSTATAGATTSQGLDASGRPEVGTLTISGGGRTLDDLPTFVDRLASLPGVVNVLPSSNQISKGVVSFSLTASFTDQLYSHAYDVAKSGGK
jgi:hypothetical protein